ncbi:MAG: DUF2283 domain-containing protein [Candidatus Aenigmarchaeota archaeon]|nr:DUF2283 domain-containing protein [Candidatus Aenigmarchaeota archaeon]
MKRYNYDEKSDSLFICIREGEEESFEEIAPGINIELDKNNEMIGIEILHASRFAGGGRRKASFAGEKKTAKGQRAISAR